ncbi:MAG TPA: ATP-binding protein [Candidatus Angelobacter sp.]
MYSGLQSVLLAEVSAPLILLGGAVLLYGSFRKKYLLPWIAGWAVYSLSKFFLALTLQPNPAIWLALANLVFALAAALFSTAIFYYVDQPRLLFPISLAVLFALALGWIQPFWPAHSSVVAFIFGISWRIFTWFAALRLILFAQGRNNVGAWVLGAALLLLAQHHPTFAYGLVVDVLLGISMMVIVLEDSRIQIQRMDTLNRISRAISSSDDFLPAVDTALNDLLTITHARAGWFRILDDQGALQLAAHKRLPDAFVNQLSKVDPRSVGYTVADKKIAILEVSGMVPEARPLMAQHGIQHIVVVPVVGKTSPIGVLVLGMNRRRTYSEDDQSFLHAAAGQIGLAAENRRLVQELVRSVKDLSEVKAVEAGYKTLFEHVQEGVFVSSPEGRIIDCNNTFFRMLGYSSREELMQEENVAERLYLDMDDRRKFLAEMEEHGFVRNFEFSLKRKDGRQITVIESSFAASDPDGTGERYQGVVLDITEKKQAEDEIRRRNRELSALNTIAVTFNQSFDLDEILHTALVQIVELFGTDTVGFYLFDHSTNILRKRAGYGHRSAWLQANTEFPMAQEVVDGIQADHTEIIKDRSIIAAAPFPGQFIEAEKLNSLLWMVLWKKENILGVLGTSSRSPREFGPSDENVMIAVGRQLATTVDKIQLYEETRKAYEDLRRTQEQLLQSEKMSAVGRLISGVAHELNNPLTAISGYTQLLEGEPVSPHVREFLHKLYKQTQRAQRIVQNLLSFARQHKPQRIYADLRNVMEDTIALRDYELKTHCIVLERDFAFTLPFVVADPHQLEQVFLNIINNAVDAILEKGQGGCLQIKIAEENGFVVCQFHDSGPGMADPKHVFDPFYTTKGVGKGTGLGLSICYGIVKEHGGEITACNHSRGGSLVQVRLPIALGEKPMTEGERIAARRESALQGCVLLLDEEAVLGFEREVLSAAGLDVVALSSGEKAMEWLRQQNFDLVLLEGDASQSVNSAGVLQWICESRPDLVSRTVLMLSESHKSGLRSFLNASQVLCFVKPFDASELLALVRRVLRTSAAKAATT